MDNKLYNNIFLNCGRWELSCLILSQISRSKSVDFGFCWIFLLEYHSLVLIHFEVFWWEYFWVLFYKLNPFLYSVPYPGRLPNVSVYFLDSHGDWDLDSPNCFASPFFFHWLEIEGISVFSSPNRFFFELEDIFSIERYFESSFFNLFCFPVYSTRLRLKVSPYSDSRFFVFFYWYHISSIVFLISTMFLAAVSCIFLKVFLKYTYF